MKEFKYKEITENIIGASMKVHSALGNGCQELISQTTFVLQMEVTPLTHQRETNMPIYYLDTQIGERRVDFFVEGKICVELKAITKVDPIHFAQARKYLNTFNMGLGLLINFGTKSRAYRRLENPKYCPYLITHTNPSPLSQKSIYSPKIPVQTK